VAIVGVVVGLGIELYRPIVALCSKFDLGTLIELIGVILVTLGVAGELAVEWMTHRKERELLRIDAEIEREDKRQLAELNLLAEQEQHARVKLEKEMAGRRLNPEQKTFLQDRLRGRSRQHVYIVPGVQTLEAKTFAESLNAALGGTGWITYPEVTKPRRHIEVAGICIMAAGDGRTREAAKELSDVLEELGFMPRFREDFPIMYAQPYWPQGLVSQAGSPGSNINVVLVVILDKPEPVF